MCNANPDSLEQFLHDAYGMNDEEFQRGLERFGAPAVSAVAAPAAPSQPIVFPPLPPRPAAVHPAPMTRLAFVWARMARVFGSGARQRALPF